VLAQVITKLPPSAMATAGNTCGPPVVVLTRKFAPTGTGGRIENE
jgi:hypothetical protein